MTPNDYVLHFIFAFTSIFVIVNPVGTTMIFVSLTSGMSAADKQKISGRSTSIAFVIAILFALAGNLVLRLFGITVASLQVAGGILLFLVAIDMLRGDKYQKKVTEVELSDAAYREDISIFPIATPLLTGPGAMTTVIVLMGAAATLVEKSIVLLAIVVTFIVTYYILKSSDLIDNTLSLPGIMVLTRIMGLILGAISVNFVAAGAWSLYLSYVN
jgi:multiple antibiotic resistance protein